MDDLYFAFRFAKDRERKYITADDAKMKTGHVCIYKKRSDNKWMPENTTVKRLTVRIFLERYRKAMITGTQGRMHPKNNISTNISISVSNINDEYA